MAAIYLKGRDFRTYKAFVGIWRTLFAGILKN